MSKKAKDWNDAEKYSPRKTATNVKRRPWESEVNSVCLAQRQRGGMPPTGSEKKGKARAGKKSSERQIEGKKRNAAAPSRPQKQLRQEKSSVRTPLFYIIDVFSDSQYSHL